MKMNPMVASLALALTLAAAPSVARAQQADARPLVTYHQDGPCGCCSKWADYLRDEGFEVVFDRTVDAKSVRARYRVPGKLRSCHTAVVDGYAIEGHVPADLIRRLLVERSELAGIAVPGMPIGSPGMEGPNPQRYQVYGFYRDLKYMVIAQR
jgi:hypothetical protein